MELYIDSADEKQIAHLVAYYPIDGVTTNPSILSKENRPDLLNLLVEIKNIIGFDRKLFIQTNAKTAEEIEKEAIELYKVFGNSMALKIPMSEEGLRAVPLVKRDGICVCMTAVFSPMQALLGAKAGADYVALYVNRLDNLIGDGTGVIEETQDLFDNQSITCKVLAASFKTGEQVYRCIQAGVGAITIPLDLFPVILNHPMTDRAIEKFDSDWKKVYGDSQIPELLHP